MLETNFRRLVCLVVNFIFNNVIFFSLVGIVNKRWQFLTNIYVGYSVDNEYINEYTFNNSLYRNRYKWSPLLAGLVIQDGKIGLKFFTSSFENDFENPENKSNLEDFIAKVENIRKITGAKQKTFAGILPSILYRRRIIGSMYETEIVVESVHKAIDEVIKLEGYSVKTPLIVLGGNGFIGRRVVKNLQGREVYCVDKNSECDFSTSWPQHLTGKDAILINISRKFVLKNYIPYIWPSLILLNEVYPEPTKEEIQDFSNKGGNIYHLAGVKGRAIPSFPKAYSGAIPCSAAWKSDDIKVVVKRID